MLYIKILDISSSKKIGELKYRLKGVESLMLLNAEFDFETVIADLDKRGFCLIPSIISEKKADDARVILEQLVEEEATEESRKEKTQRIGRLAVKHPIFLELMVHPIIVSLWKKYLGEDMICSTWSGNVIFPGCEKINWHSDYPYWSIQPPYPPGRMAGQTIWMLNDLTSENGATAVLPESHLKGVPPLPEVKKQWMEDGEVLTGNRGSVLVMHGACWHTARSNKTKKNRSVLLGMYMKPWFIPQEDMRSQLSEIVNPSALVCQLMGKNQHRPNNVGENTKLKS